MPVAIIDPNASEKFDLKSLEGGYVELRTMSYEAYLKRKDMITNIRISGGKGQESSGELTMANQKVAIFEFSECIVSHNLEDGSGELLDFSKATTLRKLHPKVGQEIGDLIDSMNQFLEDEEQGN